MPRGIYIRKTTKVADGQLPLSDATIREIDSAADAVVEDLSVKVSRKTQPTAKATKATKVTRQPKTADEKDNAAETKRAVQLDTKVRKAAGRIDSALSDLQTELCLAKAGNIWRLLDSDHGGPFASWDEYLSDVVAKQMPFAFASAMRVPLVKFLTLQGLSTRKIADLAKTSQTQVRRDQAVKVAQAKADGSYVKPEPKLPTADAIKRVLAKVVANVGSFDIDDLRVLRRVLKDATEAVSDGIDAALDASIARHPAGSERVSA
jgi:hypothetical protein